MNIPRILSMAGAAIGALALTGVVAIPASADAPLKGSAFAVKLDVKAVGASLISVPPLPEAKYPPGSDKSVLKINSEQATLLSDGLVSAKVLNARSTATDGVIASRASAAELLIGLATSSESKHIKGLLGLSAELISADCSIGPDGTTTASKLVGVTLQTVAGQSKKLVDLAADVDLDAPAPNTKIEVPGVGKVVLNEQIENKNSITVNAIHVYVDPLGAKLAEGDIVVSQAKCLKTAGGPGDEPSDPSDPEPTDGPDEPEDPTTPVPTEPAGDDNNSSGDLPVTGFKLATFAGIGAALIAAGVAVLWFFRRRTATATADGDSA